MHVRITRYLREVDLAVVGNKDVGLHVRSNELRLVFQPLVDHG